MFAFTIAKNIKISWGNSKSKAKNKNVKHLTEIEENFRKWKDLS